MPVRNEAAFIEHSLGAVLRQDYPLDRLEVLIADGDSDDDTLARIAAIVDAHPESDAARDCVRIVHNPARLQAAGLNAALREARGEIIIRVDGHTIIADDYVSACVRTLRETGAANVGGAMVPAGLTPTGRAIAAATTSRFAVPAAFHVSRAAQYTDTVYMGAWPRAVLEGVGGFDERLRANEDYDVNVRIRQSGGRIFLSPAIQSVYYARSSLAALARQYFAYGAWKTATLRKHPGSVRPRQLVAPAFVATLALGPLLLVMLPATRLAWLALVAAYVALSLTFSALAAAAATSTAAARAPGTIHSRYQLVWRLPLVFATIHLAWGAGFWVGVARDGAGGGGRQWWRRSSRVASALLDS